MYTTRPTILAGVKEGDNMSWYQFRDMYRPLIFHCAKQCGVPSACFLELEQNVLVSFFKTIDKFEYDPQKGRFRNYLGTIIHNCIIQLHREKKTAKRSVQYSEATTSCDDYFEKLWEDEWRQHCFWLAYKKTKSEMPEKEIEVFELCAIKNVPATQVASSSGISLSTVYEYKNNVLSRIKGFVDEIRREDTENETLQRI